MKQINEGLKIEGFSRVRITEDDGKIVGDSGWVGPNQVTNLGFQHYLCELLASSAGSLQVTHMAIGTGGVPGAADTGLSGEQDFRPAVSLVLDTSKTIRFLATFAYGDSFVPSTKDIDCIGLFNTSEVTVGQIFAGNEYASSSCATNQNVNVSYEIRFT